jgi:CHASE3 domain sensor protein
MHVNITVNQLQFNISKELSIRMEFFGALIALILCFIVFLIVAAVIRYAIDSSKTSKRLEDLIKEVHYLRTEIKKQNNNKQGDNKYIIDEKV